MTDLMEKYTDKFTLDNRLKPGASVTKEKVAAVHALYEQARAGNRIAEATFFETVTTSDALFNAVYLTNLQVLPQFDEAPRNWSQIAGVRELPDFRPAVLRGFFGEWEGLQREGSVTGVGFNNPEGVLPVVAENAPYPYAVLSESEAAYGQIMKRGFKTGWTWEARVNDRGTDFFSAIPGEMLDVALETEDWLVWNALVAGTQAASQLTFGTTYTGAAVLDNATFSRDALVLAIFQLSQREVNGRKIQVTGGYNLIVPLGQGDAVRFLLNQQLFEVTDGSFALTASFLQDGVSQTTVIESEYVTGTNWYLLPKPGAVRRPVLELGRLRGYTSPELRVNNLTGNYAGGGAISPFEGSFDNDTIDLRIRYPLAGILWSDDYVVWSQGDNVA